MRLLILTEIPAPFRVPLFNALASDPAVELCVAFLAEHDPRRSYHVYREEFAFNDVVLPGRSIRRGGRWIVVSRGVLRLLRRFRPDVVIVGGWNQPAFWEALVEARVSRTPSLLWVESNATDSRSAPDAVRRLALRLATAFLVPGRASRAYLRSFGVADGRIFDAPNAIDFLVFAERVEAERTHRDALRARLGLEGCVFLYAGRFDREKGLDVLLDAVDGVGGQLVAAGSGPLEPDLRRRARVVGQLSRDELVPWYAAADVLVLPSRSEPWGMTLNEGAAAGLPLVATDAVGAAHDLIEPGANGFRVRPDDAAALAQALRTLASDGELRRRAGERSREIAERFRPEAWAAGVVSAARAAAR
jgi:glycosyltransferase involved in cell wall biosynthesis